ncbi:MAG: hypothetical protein HUJ74_03580 [Lachnospiraceae bacterium]|nr:hypothetical protein [Lachnospiraceae bacterium]
MVNLLGDLTLTNRTTRYVTVDGYNEARNKTSLGNKEAKKIQTIHFCGTLKESMRTVKIERQKNYFQ